jgi:hypothetical protein
MRSSKSAIVAVALCLSWVVVRSLSLPPPVEGADAQGEVVRTQQLHVVDGAGKVRGELSADGGLVLCDGKSVPRVRVAASKDGRVVLELLGPEGKASRASLHVDADGAAGLTLADAKGIPRVDLRAEPDGAADVRLFGANRRPRVSLNAADDGSAGILVHDRDGRTAIEMSVDEHDARSLLLYDQTGKRRIRLASTGGNAPQITIQGAPNEPTTVMDTQGWHIRYGGQTVARFGFRDKSSLGFDFGFGKGRAGLLVDKDGATLQFGSAGQKGGMRFRALTNGAADFSMLDTDGDLRSSVYLREDGEVGLKLCSSGAKPRIRLYVAERPRIDLFDSNGRCRSRFAIDKNGNPVARTFGAAGAPPGGDF